MLDEQSCTWILSHKRKVGVSGSHMSRLLACMYTDPKMGMQIQNVVPSFLFMQSISNVFDIHIFRHHTYLLYARVVYWNTKSFC